MSKLRRHFPLVIFAVALWAAALACNLSSDTVPPTIVPRATATPPPTIGYATLAPEELPAQATSMPQVRTESALLDVINEVQPDRLFSHITTMQNFFTRHVNSTQSDNSRGIGAAYQYITDQFSAIRDSSAGRFQLMPPHEFTVTWAGQQSLQRNIVGVIGGTETGAGIILLGAHYDSTSANFEDGAAFAPGANDNASGVAALIEIARIMSQRQHRSTIMFVAFAAEEIQRQGSIAFVRDYLLPSNIKIDAMINMDIIGSSTASNGSVDDARIRLYSVEPNDSSSRQLARVINLAAVRHAPGMTVELQGIGDREGRYSDHLSFSDAGFAAVRFIESLENPNRQHNDLDTVQNVRASYLVRSTQTILAATSVLADGPRPPQNISLRDDGNGLRTLVWETIPDATSYLVALRRPGSLIYDNYFEVASNSVTWEGFRSDRFAAVAIAAQDRTGLMGPLSFEFGISS